MTILRPADVAYRRSHRLTKEIKDSECPGASDVPGSLSILCPVPTGTAFGGAPLVGDILKQIIGDDTGSDGRESGWL